MRRAAALLLALAGCAAPPPAAPPAAPAAALPPPPEAASVYRRGLQPVLAARQMVVAAHPAAARAGLEVLRAGGSAADAAVAVQAVLGLVEPQSSGLGGGGFALHYDAATGRVQAYDGRETAPAAATENDLRWIDAADRRAPLPDARGSGRSIGTPGAVALLHLLHRDHGRLPWAGLFHAGIALATEGFPIGPRLAAAIDGAQQALRRDPDAAALFLNPDLSPRARGSRLVNPAYAETLRAIARDGPAAFYSGPVAADIVAEVARSAAGPAAPGPLTPGRLGPQDLAGYTALRREPVCTDYRAHRVCGMGPPSSGGLAVAQTLGLLEAFDLPAHRPAAVDGEGGRPDPLAVHWIAEALRLAYADRNAYVADPGFVPLPGGGPAALLDPAYLRARAALIRPDASLGTAPAGRFPGTPVPGASTAEGRGTTHVSIVDARGNAVALTSSVESSLGSFRVVRGFVLNNQLTDFSPLPADAAGPVANRLQPGKRPRSSMAPTLVVRRAEGGGLGPLVMVTGSPGGAAIVPYVAKTLVAALDWGLDAQQAGALVNVGAVNTPVTFVGGEHPAVRTADDGAADPLVAGLRARGHRVALAPQTSGVATVLRVRVGGRDRWQGGADPRREGVALGD